MRFAALRNMPSRNYADLIAWQKAMDLAEAVYAASTALPSDERFGLTSQIRRAAMSIPANIAEGEGRRTRGDLRRHLSIANGSLRELETHVILARRLHYFSNEDSERLLDQASEVGRIISGLSKSLNQG